MIDAFPWSAFISSAFASIALVFLPQSSNSAIDSKTAAFLKRLLPVDQLEQRCDIEAMDKLAADKVVAYTFAPPRRTEVSIVADGAVFRKKGEWYRLSYSCTTSANHLSVVSYQFTAGERIPHADWTRLNLYP